MRFEEEEGFQPPSRDEATRRLQGGEGRFARGL